MSGKRAKAKDKTTIRATVTPEEHDAVWWFAKNKYGITIEDFVRQAVDAYLEKLTGKGLAVLAAEGKNRGKLVQEELF